MADIVTEHAGSILRVQLNRPTKRNAMTSAMYVALAGIFNEAAKDENTRVVLWHGAGDSFCAGNDIEDFLKNPPGPGESPQARLMKALVNFDKPLVAAVHGAAIGGGTTMLTHCDFIYAGESAKFQMPFINLAVVPDLDRAARCRHGLAISVRCHDLAACRRRVVRKRLDPGSAVRCEILRAARSHEQANAAMNVCRAKDDTWFVLIITPDKLEAVAKAIGRPDLLTDPRFSDPAKLTANMPQLTAILDEIFCAEPMAHWYEVFNGVHVTFGAVRGPQEVINDPQLQANDIIVPLNGAGGKLTSTISSPLQVHGVAKVPAKRAPKIGEHNEEVLRQLGFSAAEIDGLHESGAIPKAKEHAA